MYVNHFLSCNHCIIIEPPSFKEGGGNKYIRNRRTGGQSEETFSTTSHPSDFVCTRMFAILNELVLVCAQHGESSKYFSSIILYTLCAILPYICEFKFRGWEYTHTKILAHESYSEKKAQLNASEYPHRKNTGAPFSMADIPQIKINSSLLHSNEFERSLWSEPLRLQQNSVRWQCGAEHNELDAKTYNLAPVGLADGATYGRSVA